MDMKNWNVDKTQIAAQQEALKKSMNFAYVGHGPKATGFMAKQFKRKPGLYARCVQYKTSAVPRRSISKRSALPTGSEARYSAAVTIRPPLIRIKQGKPSGRERSAPLRARAAVCRFFAPSYRFVPLKISTSVAGRSLLKLCSSRRRFPQRQVSSPLASRGM